MNAHDDHLERALGDQLRHEVDDLQAAPLAFDEVQSGARRVRRHRRLAAGVGIAAALAVVVPSLLGVPGRWAGSEQEVPPADRLPEPVHTALTLSGLELGAAPGVEYFTADGVTLPGTGTTRLPYNYNALVPSPADGGWLGWEGGGLDLRYLTEDLGPQGGSQTNGRFVSSPDRSLVSWTMPEGGAQTLYVHSTVEPQLGQAWDFPESPAVDPVDFLSDRSVVYETGDTKVTVHIAREDGSTTPLPGYVRAISASPVAGLVAVQTEAGARGGCFGVVDPAGPGQPLWNTCDYALGAFSPDGRYVLAGRPDPSGLGSPSVAVLDAVTGHPVAQFDRPDSNRVDVQQLVWETAESFLGIATEDTTSYTILRFGIDGSLEQAIDPIDRDPSGDLPIYMGQDRVRGL